MRPPRKNRPRQLIDYPLCQATDCYAVAAVAVFDEQRRIGMSLCKPHYDARVYVDWTAAQHRASAPVAVEPEPEGLF